MVSSSGSANALRPKRNGNGLSRFISDASTLATNILGPITIISNGVADAVLAYPANFSSNPVSNLAVSVLSSLGASGIANLTGQGLVGSLLATVLNVVGTAIVPLVVSIVSVLTSTLGITVGSADYVGIRPSDPVCAAPRLAS